MRDSAFIMNLLKLFERKWVLIDPKVMSDQETLSTSYHKIYSVINLLNNELSYDHIPQSLDALGLFSVRIAILGEKYIKRAFKTLTHQFLLKHLENLKSLSNLCAILETSPLNCYFEGKNYSTDLEIERLISIYKFARRFIYSIRLAQD